ncbi:MAG: hypothetical protein AAFV25_12235 [Bacteroidota bacterium]
MCLGLTSCGEPAQRMLDWKSQYHDLSFRYPDRWTLEVTEASESLTIAGLSVDEEVKSYTVKVSPDDGEDDLALDYYQFEKERAEKEPRMRLLKEAVEEVHGAEYLKLVFLRELSPRQKQIEHVWIRSTGKELIEIRISFPRTLEGEKSGELPVDIQELEKGIFIFEEQQ